LCDNCARNRGVCAKCLESKEIIITKEEALLGPKSEDEEGEESDEEEEEDS
jgi:hypothetical protein